ncbi:hypothetical protein SG34_029975 [Thalassomonas viridans]|uniref:Bacterial toxin 8 domain-containing protein n=1 Tax=Thalassomonas viridans TaxID=137584 RepID=A0AAE9Z923_9GAMM|nr:polymorphic toxin type 8 domain-containing protein [Thalassomonas viridans]WDE09011.1 hypothetical protein SG34_029975 [Thalassomonas viridans]
MEEGKGWVEYGRGGRVTDISGKGHVTEVHYARWHNEPSGPPLEITAVDEGMIAVEIPNPAGLLKTGGKFLANKVIGKAIKTRKNFAGKQNRNQRLKDLVNDDKVSSADRGWIKQEMNEVAARKKNHLRNPPGKDLAHERGRENAKGYGYEHAHLQNRKDHKSQHKLDNWGKNNIERPIK